MRFDDSGKKIVSTDNDINRDAYFDVEGRKTYYIACGIYNIDGIQVHRLETNRFTVE